MKHLILCLMLAACSAAWGQTSTYSNLDDSAILDPGGGTYGWGWCTTCAGGMNEDQVTLWTAANQTRPSLDGGSREFYISGPAYGDGLWWYKVGPNDSATAFVFDFWANFGGGTKGAQALEFDVFQFVAGTRYMFGTQCDYHLGVWDVWDQAARNGAGAWVPTPFACPQFKPNTWYHIALAFHRSPDALVHYDTIKVDQYGPKGIVSTYSYNVNLTEGSGPMPAGWAENLGVQFQMDIGPTGTTMTEYVDRVTLSAQ